MSNRQAVPNEMSAPGKAIRRSGSTTETSSNSTEGGSALQKAEESGRPSIDAFIAFLTRLLKRSPTHLGSSVRHGGVHIPKRHPTRYLDLLHSAVEPGDGAQWF